MSKYNTLWEYVQRQGSQSFKLTFDEIQNIAGVSVDHSFLNYKKELVEYGYQVGKISMKDQTVMFEKMGDEKLGSWDRWIYKLPQHSPYDLSPVFFQPDFTILIVRHDFCHF